MILDQEILNIIQSEQLLVQGKILEGGTKTQKIFVNDKNNNSWILKYGEKVSLEINGYKLANSIYPNKIPIFKAVNPDVILVEYIEGNRLDIILENDLKSSIDMISVILDYIYNSLHSYSEYSTVDLYETFIENLVKKSSLNNDIINKEIILNDIYYPSLSKQIIKIINYFNNFRYGKIAYVHGDLQPSNIIIKNEDFRIIDWSNIGVKDICLDISKLYSYSIVPYRFQLYRDNLQEIGEMFLKIDNSIIIKQNKKFNNSNVYNSIFQDYVKKISIKLKDSNFQMRFLIYAWMHQFITIQRHQNNEKTLGMIITNCCIMYSRCLSLIAL